MMRIRLCLFFLACFFSSLAQEKTGSNETLSSDIIVYTDEKIHAIRPEFWGTNLLYWLDDDEALADGKIASRIKEAGIKLLRYPGGTVADNFHWKTNTLENIHMFPYQSGDAETDFDEFMALCRETGAEPMCVLNTETWAVKKDVAAGAHEAAEWLRYCKKKGYRVKYWEIGNETYWHPVMSAAEYADLVNVYADSLKRIDPEIMLGINGHWDIDFSGTKERFKSEAMEQLMKYRNHISSRQDYDTYKKYLKDHTRMPVTSGNTKWWQTVAERCGRNADMIIIHWYFSPNQLRMVGRKLTEVRELFQSLYPDKKFLLNISEYNVTQRTPASFLHLTEMVGAMLKAKTDIAAVWPMRMEYKKPVLLNFKTAAPSIYFQVHRQLSANLTGELVQTVSPDKVPTFASGNKNAATVVMTGSRIDKATPVTIRIQGSGRKFNSCTIWRIKGSEFDYSSKEEKVAVNEQALTVNLQPSEMLMAVFK